MVECCLPSLRPSPTVKPAVTKSFLLCLALLVGAELVVRVFFVRSMSGRFDYGYLPGAGDEIGGYGTHAVRRVGCGAISHF